MRFDLNTEPGHREDMPLDGDPKLESKDSDVGEITQGARNDFKSAIDEDSKAAAVLDKLDLLNKKGSIDPKEYPAFVEALKKLKPECWQDLKIISHFKIPFIKAYYEGSFGLNIVGLHKKTNRAEFVHEIGHHIWRTLMSKDNRKTIKNVFSSLSKEERNDTQYIKHGLSNLSAQEWACQAFATWFHEMNPGYTNLITNPKTAAIVELFESFVTENDEDQEVGGLAA